MPPKGYYERLAKERQEAIERMLKLCDYTGSYATQHNKRRPTPLETEAKAVGVHAAKLNVGFSVN